jgi:hypothetical protein
VSPGETADEDEAAHDWWTRTPVSAALRTTRAARPVDRDRRSAVRAGRV